jgi:hypothetical protein
MRVIKRTPQVSQDEADAIEEVRQRRFLKAMALKEQIGLTTPERYELALIIPGMPDDYDGSWQELNPKQLHDLITMMEGYVYITYLLSQRLDSGETTPVE